MQINRAFVYLRKLCALRISGGNYIDAGISLRATRNSIWRNTSIYCDPCCYAFNLYYINYWISVKAVKDTCLHLIEIGMLTHIVMKLNDFSRP